MKRIIAVMAISVAMLAGCARTVPTTGITAGSDAKLVALQQFHTDAAGPSESTIGALQRFHQDAAAGDDEQAALRRLKAEANS